MAHCRLGLRLLSGLAVALIDDLLGSIGDTCPEYPPEFG
jgi:hypothetical protein